jgi:hypothetical protein
LPQWVSRMECSFVSVGGYGVVGGGQPQWVSRMELLLPVCRRVWVVGGGQPQWVSRMDCSFLCVFTWILCVTMLNVR